MEKTFPFEDDDEDENDYEFMVPPLPGPLLRSRRRGRWSGGEFG
jgi:hypothetical protein